jgi:3-deoxy-D-manno-octulosonic-acid transferase
MFVIYSFLYSMVLLVLLPFEYFKRPKGLRSRWLRERFGLIDSTLANQDERPVWVHAVSVGEALSAVPLIKELKKRYPRIRIVLSTVTDTGQNIASQKLSGIAQIVYLPFDLATVLRRMIRSTRPSLFIVMETELWPNIFRVFGREKIPVLIFNGRISDNSFRGYRKIKFFMEKVLGYVDIFCVQERVYKERIEALGADEKKVRVLGNFKFDIEPPDKLPEWSGFLKGPVVLAGSTHEGEEELMVSVFERLKKDFPGLNLILAPRHPERFDSAEQLVKAKGLPYVRRSGLAACSSLSPRKEGGVVLILDTIGELASAYGLADVAVMGGSFSDHGGHNPLEPAFWSKPVICGPHMENFPFVEEFYATEGAVEAQDAGGLYDTLKELFLSPEKRNAMGERAKLVYTERAGAVKKAMAILEGYLKS